MIVVGVESCKVVFQFFIHFCCSIV